MLSKKTFQAKSVDLLHFLQAKSVDLLHFLQVKSVDLLHFLQVKSVDLLHFLQVESVDSLHFLQVALDLQGLYLKVGGIKFEVFCHRSPGLLRCARDDGGAGGDYD